MIGCILVKVWQQDSHYVFISQRQWGLEQMHPYIESFWPLLKSLLSFFLRVSAATFDFLSPLCLSDVWREFERRLRHRLSIPRPFILICSWLPPKLNHIFSSHIPRSQPTPPVSIIIQESCTTSPFPEFFFPHLSLEMKWRNVDKNVNLCFFSILFKIVLNKVNYKR